MSANPVYINFDEPVQEEPAPSYEAEILQGSPEWFEKRGGMISASRMCQMMADGQGITRDKYKYKLAVERLTGKPIMDGFKTEYTERGVELEPQARDYYEFYSGSTITQVPFIYHAETKIGLASPDALVDDDGLLEIKCPKYSTHIGYLINKKIPRAYLLQIFWQLACTKRKWCDWMSYCPELPANMKALIIRVDRNEGEIQTLEREARKFNNEVNDLVSKLRNYK
jgi:putative phage-type endonuclease